MGRRLMWVADDAIYDGPDAEGYWLIDGGGYEVSGWQAIADAPKCEHGKVDRHTGYVRDTDGELMYWPNGAVRTERCEGAPELRALLTALNQENKT